ncbi:universal stress protein family protein [Fibrisoma limi BUZ 3]|uniref:Universal stress protein family protein n=1 Tax=Fibrisoma limi BUZ 3 TaxID=1185876 RepID=I2GFU1_9BACT|nr:universal stress protein [Fibrisoma limi]CCH52766.1 universal stress protein family protein [Fibrisoma limi BUZ 3]
MKKSVINRILVSVDLSDTSKAVLNLAKAMSRRHQAELRLLHVITPEDYPFTAADNLMVSVPRTEVLEADVRRLHQWADSVLDGHPMPYSVECRTGTRTDRLVEAAHEIRADLIIMGAQRPEGLLKYVLGPETYHVIKQAPCPVLTVPEGADVSNFRQILFPLRPVPGTMNKYDLTRSIARKNNAHLTVLALLSQEEPDSGETLNSAMASLNEHLSADALDADVFLSETDSAAKTVLQQADERHADLIVVTADTTTGLRNLLSGPFFKQVINRATVPVLAIKPREVDTQSMQPIREMMTPEFPSLRALRFG